MTLGYILQVTSFWVERSTLGLAELTAIRLGFELHECLIVVLGY